MSFWESVAIESIKIPLTGFVAAVTFIGGQIAIRFVFDPVSDMRQLLGKLESDLVFTANLFSGPEFVSEKEWNDATSTLRRHSAELRSAFNRIPCYRFVARWARLPCQSQIGAAAKGLIGLSNTSKSNPNFDRIEELESSIRENLGFTAW